jgi:prepilin-type N-terminal cleavage/methylation domain-containing protein
MVAFVLSLTHRSARTRRGFTLIEAMLSMIVLVVAFMGSLAAIPVAFNNTLRDSERVQAIAAGQQYLDALSEYVTFNGVDTNLPAAPTIAVDAGERFEGDGVAATSPGNFTITNNGCPAVTGSNAEFDCVVTVKWTENSANRTVTVESYVTSQKN